MPAKKRPGQSNASSSTVPSQPGSPPAAIAPSLEKLPPLPLGAYFSLSPVHLGLSLLASYLVLSPKTFNSSARQGGLWLRPLIDSPGRTIAFLCVFVFMVQVWWGKHLRAWRKEGGKTREQVVKEQELARRRRAVVGGSGESRASPSFLAPLSDALLITLPSSLIIHVAVVLHGAPFFDRAALTFLLALLVALQAVLPTAYVVGWNQGRERAVWVRLFSTVEPRNDLEIALVCPAFGTLVGTWVGAIPIPLDWDRPWQRYPTTCVVGTVLGHALGLLVAMGWIAARAIKEERDLVLEAHRREQKER